MTRVDLNADLGESFGAYSIGQDEAMLTLVTSASIACGFHAGDPNVMARTVAHAAACGVALGAHPGLPDLQGFGRRTMQVTPDEVYNLVAYQIGALAAFARRSEQELRHVKPHGALYTMAERNGEIARAIVCAAHDWDTQLLMFGLSGGLLIRTAQEGGLSVAQEVFADRTYQPDGSLTPRIQPDAFVDDAETAAKRMVRLLMEGKITATDGTQLMLTADTICLHGDSPGTVERARQLRAALRELGVAFLRPKSHG